MPYCRSLGQGLWEVRSDLTRGMSVVDARPHVHAKPNVELAVGLDTTAVRDYMARRLRETE